MRAGQREACGGMIESGALPLGGRVAHRTILREASRRVVRIRSVLICERWQPLHAVGVPANLPFTWHVEHACDACAPVSGKLVIFP